MPTKIDDKLVTGNNQRNVKIKNGGDNGSNVINEKEKAHKKGEDD